MSRHTGLPREAPRTVGFFLLVNDVQGACPRSSRAWLTMPGRPWPETPAIVAPPPLTTRVENPRLHRSRGRSASGSHPLQIPDSLSLGVRHGSFMPSHRYGL